MTKRSSPASRLHIDEMNPVEFARRLGKQAAQNLLGPIGQAPAVPQMGAGIGAGIGGPGANPGGGMVPNQTRLQTAAPVPPKPQGASRPLGQSPASAGGAGAVSGIGKAAKQGGKDPNAEPKAPGKPFVSQKKTPTTKKQPPIDAVFTEKTSAAHDFGTDIAKQMKPKFRGQGREQRQVAPSQFNSTLEEMIGARSPAQAAPTV